MGHPLVAPTREEFWAGVPPPRAREGYEPDLMLALTMVKNHRITNVYDEDVSLAMVNANYLLRCEWIDRNDYAHYFLAVIHGIPCSGSIAPHRDPRMLVAYKGETVGAVRQRLMRQEGASDEDADDDDNWQFFWMGSTASEHRLCEDLEEPFAHDDDFVTNNQLWVFSPEDPDGPSQRDFWALSCQMDRGRIRIAQNQTLS
eukprot:CAMPEP_0173450186 /NCGR_PEP_ID=MMETSP1357-20121228/44204_1 /TAXON_ID=77926 /ORGANISM="Hemiselmis rufescens, Strain PCC563" /LENGTH=200 /DNA_ID=CAMNT_0014416839 /DNA_START=15 /DNA_END=614 /DNA_ORIENTATION=+